MPVIFLKIKHMGLEKKHLKMEQLQRVILKIIECTEILLLSIQTEHHTKAE